MIEISGQVLGAERVIMNLVSAPERVRVRLREEVARLGATLQRNVKQSKLSGQVLNVRTGRLRRSINLAMSENGDLVMARVGTNVAYARRYEMGGTWVEKVRAHTRRNRGQIKAASYTNKFGRVVVGKKGKSSGTILVRSFEREVKVKPRSFLRTSLNEMRDTIRTRLLSAVAGGF